MGMTYRLDTVDGYELINDMVFDRERLGFFMGLKTEDIEKINQTGRCFVTMEHIDRAIKFLTDFNDRIRAMPIDTGSEAYKALRIVDNKVVVDEEGYAIYDYFGTPNNIAVLKEVEKVLNKTYHFVFPWDKIYTDDRFGVTRYISALKEAKKLMHRFRSDKAVLLYY